MSKKSKEAKRKAQAEAAVVNASQKAKMRFPVNVFYNDPTTPLYKAGQVYEIVGGDMIQRWLKRGGEIVDEKSKVTVPESQPNEVKNVSEVEADKSEETKKEEETIQQEPAAPEAVNPDDFPKVLSEENDED